jgi:hypothetical protein
MRNLGRIRVAGYKEPRSANRETRALMQDALPSNARPWSRLWPADQASEILESIYSRTDGFDYTLGFHLMTPLVCSDGYYSA